MTRAVLLFLVFLLSSTISGASGATSSSAAGERLEYRHAYYLFLSGTPVGCEDCYVPLLITTESLEQIAQDRTKAACALITTYERDSIWHNEGLVSVAPTDIRNRRGSFTFEGDGIGTRKSVLQKHSDSCKIRSVPFPSHDRCCLLVLRVRQWKLSLWHYES
jgi:hypothetical protein